MTCPHVAAGTHQHYAAGLCRTCYRHAGAAASDAYTLADLACELAVPVARVRYWVASGQVRAYAHGTRLSDAAIHAFLCAHPAAWQRPDYTPTPWITGMLTDAYLRAAHRGCGPRTAQPGAPRRAFDRYTLVQGDAA